MDTNKTKLIEFLHNRTKLELPGFKSHQKMIPTQQGKPFRPTKAPSDARKSAVLLLLQYNTQTDVTSILFTLRSNRLKKHSNQISFPGGKCDTGESFAQTALRETKEEVGIDNDQIEIIGSLTQLFVPPSNSLIQPVIGFTEKEHKLKINPAEVSEAFFVELGILLDPKTRKIKPQKFEKIGEAEVPYFDIHRDIPLWGATAIILAEFLDLLSEYK